MCTPPSHEAWTLVVWRVVRGQERAFVDAWHTLRDIVTSLERPPLWCLLVQNQFESGTFYSFGPWDGFEAVESMRRDVKVQEAFQRLVDCCHEATSDTCQAVTSASLIEPRASVLTTARQAGAGPGQA